MLVLGAPVHREVRMANRCSRPIAPAWCVGVFLTSRRKVGLDWTCGSWGGSATLSALLRKAPGRRAGYLPESVSPLQWRDAPAHLAGPRWCGDDEDGSLGAVGAFTLRWRRRTIECRDIGLFHVSRLLWHGITSSISAMGWMATGSGSRVRALVATTTACVRAAHVPLNRSLAQIQEITVPST